MASNKTYNIRDNSCRGIICNKNFTGDAIINVSFSETIKIPASLLKRLCLEFYREHTDDIEIELSNVVSKYRYGVNL